MPLRNNPSGKGGSRRRGSRPRLDPTVYRTLTREQWLLRETRLVAALLVDEGLEGDEIVGRVQRKNLFRYPTERMRANIARVCLARIESLGEGEPARRLTWILAHGTDEQARQANLYTIARGYRLVRECLLTVVAERLRACEAHLSRAELDAFFAELSQQSDVVSGWSPATVGKCRLVLAHCLVEAGVLDPVPRSRGALFEVRPMLLDAQVAADMRANGDAELVSALVPKGV